MQQDHHSQQSPPRRQGGPPLSSSSSSTTNKARSGSSSGDLTTYYTERPAMMSSSQQQHQRRLTASHVSHTTAMGQQQQQQQQHTRLYKAPQPTLRNVPQQQQTAPSTSSPLSTHGVDSTILPSLNTTTINSTESKTGYARRRRQSSNTNNSASTSSSLLEGTTGTGFRGQSAAVEQQQSHASIPDSELQLHAASNLTRSSDKTTKTDDLFRSLPDGLLWKSSYESTAVQRGGRNINNVGGAHVLLGDMSEPRHDNSSSLFGSDRPQHPPQQHPKRTKQQLKRLWQCHVRSFFTPVHFLQLLALVLLTGMIYDSHHKVKAHRSRLQQYDEERSHILEQMMWMDQAAKKVHASSLSSAMAKDNAADMPEDASLEALQQENKRLQEQLEHIQVRIQLNARDKIHERYADKPMMVTLQLKLLSTNEQTDATQPEFPIELELSDDTPHAVDVLLQQIDNGQWNDMVFETIQPGVVQVSSQSATGSPLLEFVEESRSCNTAGSVALHGAVVDQIIHVLYLRIYLHDNAVLPKDDVCIGSVARGLEFLHRVPTSDG